MLHRPQQWPIAPFLVDENSRMQSLAAAAALLVVPFMLHGPSETKIIVAPCIFTLLCVEERSSWLREGGGF